MSGASKTNTPLVLYAEGVDPEADLVLVCGQRKFCTIDMMRREAHKKPV